MADGEGMIVRPDDFVVLGVRWADMDPVAGSPADPPALVAGPAGGRLIVMLPPQHVGETPVRWDWWDCMWTSLKGSLPPGAPIAARSSGPVSVAVFGVEDGRQAFTDSWTEGLGWDGRFLEGATLPPGAAIATVVSDGEIVVYAVDEQGSLRTHRSAGEEPEWSPNDGSVPGTPDSFVSGFRPGSSLAAVSRDGVTDVFIPRAGRLAHWRNFEGMQVGPDRDVSPDAAVTAVRFDGAPENLFVLSVAGDGHAVCDVRDESRWSLIDLGAPDTWLRPSSPVAAVTGSVEESMVFAVGAEGTLWGLVWLWLADEGRAQVGEWTKLGEGFPPGAAVSAVAVPGAVGPEAVVLAVNDFGIVWAHHVRSDPKWRVNSFFLGDWFPPGSHVSAVARGQDFHLFAVSADRTVRTMVWPGGPWGVLDEHPSWVEAGTVATQPARLAGISCLGFSVPAGETVSLTAPGVLAEMRRRPLVAAGADIDAMSGHETAIELPWGLTTSVDLPTGTEKSVVNHVEAPIVSPAGAVELWHTRMAREGTSTDGHVTQVYGVPPRLRPIGCREDPPPPEEAFRPPLDGGQRQTIFEKGRLSRGDDAVVADRLTLTALGGWLSAGGSWPGFDWEHEAVCGRDMRVRTVRHGVLYPLGHRAEYVELTQRRFDPRSDRSTAILHKQGTLFIREPVRRYADQDSPDFRQFPFTEVEIATAAVTDIDSPVWEKGRRTPEPTILWDEIERVSHLLLTEEDPTERERLEFRLELLGNLALAVEEYSREFDVFFAPSVGGLPVLLPVWLRGPGGDVPLRMPQLFVDDEFRGEVGLGEGVIPDQVVFPAYDALRDPRLEMAFAPRAQLDMPAAAIRLAGSQIFETHGLKITGAPQDRGVRPRIVSAKVALQALRELTGAVGLHEVTFDPAYRDTGDMNVLLRPKEQIDVNFGKSDRSGGLANPSFFADAISGSGAPIKPAAVDAQSFFQPIPNVPTAKLLGMIPLQKVIAPGEFKRPAITSLPQAMGVPPAVSFQWTDVKLDGSEAFRPMDPGPCLLTLNVESVIPTPGAVPRVTTSGRLTRFELSLAEVLVVSFEKLGFTSRPSEKPSLAIDGLKVAFDGDLKFLSVLQAALEGLDGGIPVAIEATPDHVRVSQHAALPDLTLPIGPFSVSLRNAAFHSSLLVPFEGEIEVDLGFGTSRQPFLVGVWILGGGGYIGLKIRNGELTELEASVEIGGLWAFDWVVVAGEVHALAGIKIRLDAAGVRLTGYLRAGGSVEVFGFLSISIEITAMITAGNTGQDERFQVVASASLVIEVDLFLTSADLRLEKTILIYEDGDTQSALDAPGGGRGFSIEQARDAWMEYRAAFGAQEV